MLAAIAAVLTAVFYGRAWRFDLQCDDLLVIRPWSNAELFAVWHGTWEPGGAFAVFYRPLAAWFYAGTFELFGWNAPAHMLLSLAMLAIVAWLLGVFVMRESGSGFAGAAAAFIYLAHPNVPWSTGIWVTNDFHKLTAIAALSALLLWQRVRTRAPSRWALLVPLVLICFLVKEDGVMLIPALVSLQWARAKLVGDVKRPGLVAISIAALVAVTLVLWRQLALGELGGFDLPRSAADVVRNLARGPVYAFTLHGSLSALTLFETLLAAVLAIFVALSFALMPKEKRFLPAAGLILMFWYDLPLALISNVMRYYMLTIAAVMVVVPVFLSFTSAATNEKRWPAYAAGLMTLLLIVQTGTQSRELNRFAPCGSLEHQCVSWVLEEVNTLPPEARAYVAGTRTACAVNSDQRPRIGENGTLTWGLGATTVDTDTSERASSVTGDVVSLIQTTAASASLWMRHRDASATRPIRVDISADGRTLTRELTTPGWTTIDVPLTNGIRSWMRGAHRVDTRFSVAGADWK